MPDAPAPAPTTEFGGAVDHLEAMMRGAIEGDRKLRFASALRVCERLDDVPLFVSRSLSGRMRVGLEWTEEKRFLFVFRRTSGRRVGRVAIDFALEPWPEPPDMPDEEPALLLRPPRALLPSANPEQVQLRLHSGRLLEAEFEEDELPKVLYAGSEEDREKWGQALIIDALRTIAGYVSEGAMGPPRPIARLDRPRSLDLFLHWTGWHIARVARAMHDVQPPEDLEPWLRSLFPSYRVQGAEVSVRAWIAPDGTLAYGEEEMEKAKEIDLRMRLDTGGGRWRVEVSSRPPDFLVGGETHRKFWEALEAVDDALVEEVEDELSKDLGGAFRAFLSSPGLMRRTIILRIDSDDNDLVLMTGQGGIHRGWLLFKVRFETEKGVVRVKDDGDDVELLAAELGESKQLKGKHRKRLTRHLTAWLIGLRDWQRRMALA